MIHKLRLPHAEYCLSKILVTFFFDLVVRIAQLVDAYREVLSSDEAQLSINAQAPTTLKYIGDGVRTSQLVSSRKSLF